MSCLIKTFHDLNELSRSDFAHDFFVHGGHGGKTAAADATDSFKGYTQVLRGFSHANLVVVS